MSEADKIIKNLKNSGKKVEEFYVSNKTSDKNVAKIEDDVDELKSIMNLRTDSGFAYSQKNTLSLQKAIKNVLADYTRQKEMNEEHQKINGELRKKVKELEEENKLILNSKVGVDLSYEDYIPKQKIKEKIEEVKQIRRELGFKTYLKREHMLNEDREIVIKIQVLQELLQESEDK